MKPYLLFPLLFAMSGALTAQTAYYTNLQSQLSTKYNLSGGQWVLPADEAQALGTFSGYGGNLSGNINTTGQAFTRSRQMTVSSAGAQPWSSGLLCSNTQPLAKGTIGLMVIWLRSATAGTAKVNLFLEKAQTFEKEIFITLELGPTWKQYLAPFTADFDYAAGQLTFGLHAGFKAQTVQFGGVALLDFQNRYPLDRFPVDLHIDYVGSAPTAAWRAEAAQRIEQIRKADLNLTLTTAAGAPLSGATVTLEMLEHDFKFGSAVTANRIAGNRQQNNTYQQKILDFDGKGHGFNEVVFENDMKWDAWEERWFVSPAELVKAVGWLHQQGIGVRGHTLVWPGWQWLPDDLQANQKNPEYLRKRINDHLRTMLTYPGIQGIVKEWDVLNEITFNEDLAGALAGTPGFTTGRELYVDIIKKVRELDPSVKVYLNDYSSIDQGNLPGNPAYERTKQYFREIQQAGVKIDGIGFQGHISSGLVSIPDVKTILDDFYNSFGARAKITEYDYGNLVSDSMAARFTADFLTMCFSHPSVDGFLSWGFWNGAHWLNNGPFFRLDWSMRPAGQAVADLLFKQWWTNATLNSNAQGQAKMRGFKGKYRLRVSVAGKEVLTDTLWLRENANINLSLPTVVDVNDPQQTKFSVVMANPAPRGRPLRVVCSAAPQQVWLVDLQGRRQSLLNAPGASFELVTPNAPGLYLLQLHLPTGVYTQRVVVE